MKVIEAELVDLIEMAETPLYSAYQWMSRELGGNVALGGFLDLIQDLVDREVLRLWFTDSEACRRISLKRLPSDLQAGYSAIPGLDGQYDPFDLTLTTGPSVERQEPEWQVDLNFIDRTFVLMSLPDTVPPAYEQLNRLYAPMSFIEETRVAHGKHVHIKGSLQS